MFGSVTRGRARYSDAEIRAQAALHVTATLSNYEAMDDDQLARNRAGVELDDPKFVQQVTVASVEDPAIKERWAAITSRAWAAKPSPDTTDRLAEEPKPKMHWRIPAGAFDKFVRIAWLGIAVAFLWILYGYSQNGRYQRIAGEGSAITLLDTRTGVFFIEAPDDVVVVDGKTGKNWEIKVH